MIENIINWIKNVFSSDELRYSCVLVGEKYNDKNETIIVYRIRNRPDVYETSLEELVTSPWIIEKFHPTDALKLGIIVCGDILSRTPAEQRESRYQAIKNSIIQNLDKRV